MLLKECTGRHLLPCRADSEHIKEVVKPFDWTFTTDYKGTMFGKEGAKMHVSSVHDLCSAGKVPWHVYVIHSVIPYMQIWRSDI